MQLMAKGESEALSQIFEDLHQQKCFRYLTQIRSATDAPFYSPDGLGWETQTPGPLDLVLYLKSGSYSSCQKAQKGAQNASTQSPVFTLDLRQPSPGFPLCLGLHHKASTAGLAPQEEVYQNKEQLSNTENELETQIERSNLIFSTVPSPIEK